MCTVTDRTIHHRGRPRSTTAVVTDEPTENASDKRNSSAHPIVTTRPRSGAGSNESIDEGGATQRFDSLVLLARKRGGSGQGDFLFFSSFSFQSP